MGTSVEYIPMSPTSLACHNIKYTNSSIPLTLVKRINYGKNLCRLSDSAKFNKYVFFSHTNESFNKCCFARFLLGYFTHIQSLKAKGESTRMTYFKTLQTELRTNKIKLLKNHA